MNINFELYKVFYTVAKYESITKAANILHISQPAISKSIKNLEQSLKGQLFKRNKKGVTLTEEGKEFYTYISQAIDFINNAEHKFTELINLETGTIKIGINTTLTKIFLIPILEHFHKIYPKIKIEITPGLTSVLITKLKQGLLDIVIFNRNDKETIKGLKLINCKKIHDTFFVGENLKELKNKTISLNDLHNYPLILPAKNSSSRTFLDNFTSSYNINLTSTLELASHSLIYEFTKINLGIGFGPKEYIEEYLKEKKLFLLNIKEKIPSRNITLAISKTIQPNFSTKKFIEIIEKTP